MNNQTIHNADNAGVWGFFQNLAGQVAGGFVNKLTGNGAPVGQATPSQTPVYTPAPASGQSTAKKWLPWAIGLGAFGIIGLIIALVTRRGK